MAAQPSLARPEERDTPHLLLRRTTGRTSGHLALNITLLAATYAYWRGLHQWFFLQRDDFWLVTITTAPEGQFGVADFFWSWRHDWLERNGRSADAVVRLILRPGESATGWLAPALLTGCSAVGWRWLSLRLEGTLKVASMILILTLIPISLLTAPSIAGNTVFWAAGMGNYVVPTAVAILAASWWVRPPLSRTGLLVAAGCTLLAGLLHEMAALTVCATASIGWVVMRGRRYPYANTLFISALASLSVGFIGPGRWRRLDALVADSTGMSRWLSSAARFTSEILLETGPLWIVFLLCLSGSVAAIWSSCEFRARRRLVLWSGASWAGALTTWGALKSWRPEGVRCSQLMPLEPESRVGSLIMLAAGATTALAVLGVCIMLVHHLGRGPLLLAVGTLASLPLPMATGQCAPRVWYVPLIWLLLAISVTIVESATKAATHRFPLTISAAVGLSLALIFHGKASPALKENYESFQTVVSQIPGVRDQGQGTITFPLEVPHPDFGKSPVYRLPSIACGFRVYFAIPDDVILDNGEQPRSGLPEYCPRPDSVRRP